MSCDRVLSSGAAPAPTRFLASVNRPLAGTGATQMMNVGTRHRIRGFAVGVNRPLAAISAKPVMWGRSSHRILGFAGRVV